MALKHREKELNELIWGDFQDLLSVEKKHLWHATFCVRKKIRIFKILFKICKNKHRNGKTEIDLNDYLRGWVEWRLNCSEHTF